MLTKKIKLLLKMLVKGKYYDIIAIMVNCFYNKCNQEKVDFGKFHSNLIFIFLHWTRLVTLFAEKFSETDLAIFLGGNKLS